MTLYTGHVESIRNITQLAGMIFLFPPTTRSAKDLNQALFITIKKRPVWGGVYFWRLGSWLGRLYRFNTSY